MKTVIPIEQAQTMLSTLIARAAQGETILIGDRGKAVAKLVRIDPEKPKKIFGAMKGELVVPDDFDAPLPDELIDAFEGALNENYHQALGQQCRPAVIESTAQTFAC